MIFPSSINSSRIVSPQTTRPQTAAPQDTRAYQPVSNPSVNGADEPRVYAAPQGGTRPYAPAAPASQDTQAYSRPRPYAEAVKTADVEPRVNQPLEKFSSDGAVQDTAPYQPRQSAPADSAVNSGSATAPFSAASAASIKPEWLTPDPADGDAASTMPYRRQRRADRYHHPDSDENA